MKITRPSGIVQSENGKYFYLVCTISGAVQPLTQENFTRVLGEYGNDENVLAKTFATKKAKTLVESGVFTAEGLRDHYSRNGSLPSTKGLAPEKVEEENPVVDVPKQVVQPTAPERVEYPWSKDPTYFSSPAVPTSIEDETKNSCMYPTRYLDDTCHGCPVYDRCQQQLKFQPTDWEKPRQRGEKITKIFR